MSDEYILRLNRINVSNIEQLGQRLSRTEEMRIIEIYELATDITKASLELYAAGMSICEILSVMSESLSDLDIQIHKSALPLNVSRLESYARHLSAFDKLLLSDLYLEQLGNNSIKLSVSDFLPENASPETFVYVKNPLADEAYDVFSETFNEPRVTYAGTLREAVRLVSDGEVAYCLLPLEEAGGERLHTASELIFKNDLKINAVTPVFGFDGTVDMKYSLISRRFAIPEVMTDDDLYIEIRLPQECATKLRDVLDAVDYFGASVYRVSSMTFELAGKREAHYSLVFKSESGDFTSLLFYLTLFVEDYTPVGIYKNLE